MPWRHSGWRSYEWKWDGGLTRHCPTLPLEYSFKTLVSGGVVPAPPSAVSGYQRYWSKQRGDPDDSAIESTWYKYCGPCGIWSYNDDRNLVGKDIWPGLHEASPTQLRRLFPREAEQLVSENTRAEDASLLYEVQAAWADIHHGVELQSWIQAFEYIMDMDRVTPYPKYQRQANWMQLGLVASRLMQGDPGWDDGRWLVIRWDIDYVHPPEDRRWASMSGDGAEPRH